MDVLSILAGLLTGIGFVLIVATVMNLPPPDSDDPPPPDVPVAPFM